MTAPLRPSRRPRANPALALAAAALALGAAGCGPSVGPDQPASGRTLVLISLDTLRPERLGAYGGAPDVAPHIDALAADAVIFEQALAPAPWTLPSHMTMLTGLDPVAHGVHNGGVRLSRHVNTLAEQLSEAGFATAAFTDGGFVSGFYGFEQGFDVFEDERSSDGPNGMRRVAAPAGEWLADLDADDDAFLFVHSFDAHSPYDSPDAALLTRFRERGVSGGPDDHAFAWLRYLQQQVKTGLTGYHRMAQLMNDYDAGVHQADLGVGALVAALRASGRYDDALIVVTSDHGEAFFEHGLHVGHGLGHRDNELRVPLIAKLPRGEAAGGRHDELVGLVDIARTLLQAAGLEADPSLQGESLLGLVRGQPRRNDWLLGWCNNTSNGWVIKGRYKYVTPTAIAPLTIAKKHLGPVNPLDFDPSDDAGEPYDFGNGEYPGLRYDEEGDPLGLLDVLPAAEELYDRQANPGERYSGLLGDEALMAQLRSFYRAQYEVSHQLFESLRDAEAEALGGTNATANIDKAQQRILAQLGYVEGDVSVGQVAPRMRHWATTPRTPPDTAGLLDVDRRVHALRARLLDGARVGSEVGAGLQADAEAYVAWAMANPGFAPRVEWRLADLETLATLCGVSLDTSSWR